MRWQKETVAFDEATVKVGDNEAKGTVSVNTSSTGKALISSTLAFDRLDIAPYLPVSSTDHTPLAWNWWSKLATTLSPPSAPHINADIRLSTKTLSSGDVEFGPAAATVSMKDGKLSADVAEIALNSGRATGQISIDFNRYIPKLKLRGQLEEVASGKLTAALAGHRYIEGQGRLIADLSSSGISVPEILSDLRGRIEFAIPETGTVGLSISEIDTGKPGAKPRSAKEVLARAIKGSTQVTNFEAVLQIKDGVAEIAKASAGHAAGSLKMGGTYDLVNQRYNLRILALNGIKKIAAEKSAGQQPPAKKAPAPVPAQSEAPRATLLSVKTEKRDQPATIQIRALSGTLPELERHLDPQVTRRERRGL
jgi:uncharacterized protein involved in outer membrane biogenesis